MSSKNWSCKFSLPLMRKNITRFWPIWSSYFVILCLLLVVPLLTGIRTPYRTSQVDIVQGIHSLIVSAGGAPALLLSLLYGLLSAASVWSFLCDRRSVWLYESLPLSRESMFVTNGLTGLGFLLIPNLLASLLAYFCQLSLGYTDPKLLLTFFCILSLSSFLCYAVGTFCAMVTGSLVTVPVLYVLLQFGAAVCEALMNRFACSFYFGVSELPLRLTVLSPIVKLAFGLPGSLKLFSYAPPELSYGEEPPLLAHFNPEHLRTLLLYAAVSLVILLVSYLLYRRRSTDAAGEIIAIPLLRPLAKYAFTFGCSLVLGTLLQILIFPGQDSPAAVAVCLIIGGAVGYFAAAMLLYKTFRVFRLRQLPGLLILSVLLCSWVACQACDVFGVEHFVPDPASVRSVTLDTDSRMDFDDPEDILSVIRLQEAILAEKDDLQDAVDNPDYSGAVSVALDYTLEDGTRIPRRYLLPYQPEADAYFSSIDALAALLNTPEHRLQRLLPEEGCTVYSILFNAPASGDTAEVLEIAPADLSGLTEALRADILEGSVGQWSPGNMYQRPVFSFELTSTVHEASGELRDDWTFLPVFPGEAPRHTLAFLRQAEYLTADLP